MTAQLDIDVYVTALRVDEMFADPAYQRDVDNPEARARIRRIADGWDRRLVGVLEVSDRGEQACPRFAVIDGQHRWEGAKLRDPQPSLVANVHTGLTVAEEAELFDKLNRQRKQTNTWDHWKARRASADEDVAAIEEVVERYGLVTDMSPQDGRVACVATLEKVVKLGGLDLLDATLDLIVQTWGPRRDAMDATSIMGVALILWYLAAPIDHSRLAQTLIGVMPRQVKANAAGLAEITQGSLSVRTAIALMSLYNKRPGRRILVSNRTFSGKRREAVAAS